MKRAPSRIMSISNSNTSVQPYLFFGGRCEEALDFYRNAVGAEVQMLTRFKESPEPHGLPDCFDNKIMHATVRIGKTTLMASDGQCEGNQDFEGFALSITVPNETEAERVFAALGQDGLITMPLEKTFWTAKFGMLQDHPALPGWFRSNTSYFNEQERHAEILKAASRVILKSAVHRLPTFLKERITYENHVHGAS